MHTRGESEGGLGPEAGDTSERLELLIASGNILPNVYLQTHVMTCAFINF